MEHSIQRVMYASGLDRQKRSLLLERKELISSFVDAVERKKTSKLGRILEQLRQTNEVLDYLERIEETIPQAQQSTGRHYVISSLFLHECFKLLTADRDEQFFFLTGAIFNGTHVLDQRLEFGHSKRSIVGVVGNQADTHRLLIKLEQFGHLLLAHFHSHPGNGFEATNPSGTDTGFQKRLEDAGYPSVAAVFSRDGYIRFFRLDDDLEVEIYGTGVESYGKNAFRLTDIS